VRSRMAICALILGILPIAAAQDPAAGATSGDESPIRHLIEIYMGSIDAADPELGAKVWLTTPDASFIHPLGEESGWDQISADIYRKLMGPMFSKRSLKLSGEPTIHVFGDAAVAEFHWDFVATLLSNGNSVHTMGRESQLYVRLPDKGWRLVHVHYSGPAVTMPSNGNF
jgi:ketosteroid isomerase-like protein